MSEQVVQDPPIDAGIVAKVVWQAHKALQEQLGKQGLLDWEKIKDDQREYCCSIVTDYLENKESKKVEYSPLLEAIVDALIPQEKKAEKEKTSEKKETAPKAK